MTDFELGREIRTFCARLTASIRDKTAKAAVAAEYEDHIRDAMQRYLLDGMTEQAAFLQVCEDFGDVDEIAKMLDEVHNCAVLDADIRREYAVRKTAVFVVSTLVILLLYLAWDIFVIQMLLLIGGIWALLRVVVYLRALCKRRRAVRMLRRYAREFGYAIRVQKGVYTSLWQQTPTPTVVLENEEAYYKIRFLATLKKNRVLHFLGRNIYTVSHTYGNALLAITPLAPGWSLFHPRNMTRLNRSGIVMQVIDLPEDAIALPTLECRSDPREKTVQEVLIFNPAPMRVFYKEGNTEIEIAGGECRDGVWLHDLSSLRGMLERGT